MGKPKSYSLDPALAKEISSFLFALGNQFVKVKNSEGAFDCFKYCLDLDPKNSSAVFNIGCLYSLMGNREAAYRMFKEAARMCPTDLKARIAFGESARKLGKTSESAQILEEVFKLDPQSYEAMSSLALIYYDRGELDAAERWNELALAKQPDEMHSVLNQALMRMTRGRWAESWSQYEYCLSYRKNEKMRNLKMSDSWTGQEMEGKHLLVISDQGSGDAIQFSRYLGEAKALGKFAKLTFIVQPELKDLISRVEGIDQVIGFGEVQDLQHDAYSALLGILRVLEVSPDNCRRPPHIKTSDTLDERWKHLVEGDGLKVGLVWAGDPMHGNDHARSIPLKTLLDAVRIQGADLFSFQVGAAAKQLTPDMGISNLAEDFRSYDDTASALRLMDLLITCDTSVAHLAGCMGVRTFVLLPNPPEFRWLLDSYQAPWYGPHVRLIRQWDPRDWAPVMAAVRKNLEELVNISKMAMEATS